MRSRRLGVGGVLGGDPLLAAHRQVLLKLFVIADGYFFHPDDVDICFVILPNFELVSLVQQIVELPTINLEER